MKEPKINPEHIKNQAIQFKIAGKRCLEERDIDEKTFEMLIIPAIVNFAFSAELFLKYILHKQGNPKRGHDLYELYKSLDSESLTQLHFAVVAHYWKYHRIPGFDLDMALKEYALLFQEYRYIYEYIITKESMGVDYGFLQNFIGILHSLANTYQE